MDDSSRPIIIKKKVSGGGDGHHGGAWKVAYADFVTAMMAFFLLMWLLNATSEDQRKGLADYFDPSIPISRNSAGGAGMLGGDSATTPPDAASTHKEGERAKQVAVNPGEVQGEDEKSPAEPETDQQAEQALAKLPADGDGDLEGLAGNIEKQFEALGHDGLLEHFTVRTTPEGLVIEIGDLSDEPLFGSGADAPRPILQELMEILVPVLNQTTNDLAVVGHTDSSPFQSRDGYSNWELSADRANAARRILSEAGLSPDRIVRVSGRAATDPISLDPAAPRNRRIAVTLLRAAPTETGN